MAHKEYLVVHAGLIPGKALHKQKRWDVTNMRNIDRNEAVDDRETGEGWFIEWEEYQQTLAESDRQTIIYGHDAGRDLNVREHSIGLDTRCVRGGQLTALVMTHDNTTLIHQQAKQRYD